MSLTPSNAEHVPWKSIKCWIFYYKLLADLFLSTLYALIRSEMEYTRLSRCVEVIISARKPVEKSCTPMMMANSAK